MFCATAPVASKISINIDVVTRTMVWATLLTTGSHCTDVDHHTDRRYGRDLDLSKSRY